MTPSYPVGLIWLRRDLRLADNAALYHALQQCEKLYCVFVFDDSILAALPRADRRVEFICQSLTELDAALRESPEDTGLLYEAAMLAERLDRMDLLESRLRRVLELQPDHLKLEPDHVLAYMLRQMHLIVTETRAAFEPEGGAYAAGGHGHAHEHAHAHDHGHSHAPAPAPSATARGRPIGIAVRSEAAPHVHGPGCGHDH